MPVSESISSLKSDPGFTEPLYQVKLLSALRSGDPALIHPFLAEIGKDRRKSTEDDLDTGAAALHLAVRCGSAGTVALLLSHRAISPNGVHPPGSGTTPLHLAAALGRVDIVNLLLEQDSIDDTKLDSHGKTCKDVARGKDVIRAIQDSRSFLNASYRSLLRSYILSPQSSPPSTSPALLALLSSPRIRLVNLSYLDDDSGVSLLHEAAKRKDLRLIELAVRAGADVFVRDRRGRGVLESKGGDERVRVFLRQFANHDTTLIDNSPLSEPPSITGYLNKYTNVAKGYNTRYFVLKDGILSYYRHQDDESIASRGSIAMKTATLKIPSGGNDRLRFEVHSASPRGQDQRGQGAGSATVQKWYMKANHPVEAARWTQAIRKSVDWYKRADAGPGPGNGRRSGESERSARSGAPLRLAGPSSSVESGRASFSTRTLLRKAKGKAGTGTVKSGQESERESVMSSYADLTGQESLAARSVREREVSYEDEDNGGGGKEEEGEEEGDYSSSADSSSRRTPPHELNFELHGNSIAAQMELTSQLLSNLTATTTTPPHRATDIKSALHDSFGLVQSMLTEYLSMVQEREAWWRKQLERERERQGVWEESLAMVVREGETLEKELRMRSRKRGSRFFDGGEGGMGTVGRRPSLRGAFKGGPLVEESERASGESARRPLVEHVPSQSQDAAAVPAAPAVPAVVIHHEDDDEYDTDEEDEFFDAIEANALPNLLVPYPSQSTATITAGSHPHDVKSPLSLPVGPYAGYQNLRTHLNLSEERPSTSLWSVLKHSIGKDLTRISFPVFFNEPTSMLQRMAEDMEFSECLDVAAREKDPLRRIAFVGAFAMSNYSSTIGRIAKPFNPMLGETFEYVRFDREYRYLSEQVSHHPPISACWAESPTWHYYGEVDAQNKFMGKSFEIRPTGVAHAELIIPEERGPGYPRAPGKYGLGKVVEHYSWKKVTTNVSGFILGSPTIDHYGDMIITNHRTNDRCILTFKPRGWRGKDAYEISGQVVDSAGRVAYEIAGRWNSQLVARHASGAASRGLLSPDVALNSPTAAAATATAPEYTLLWRNSEKTPGAPFNLTPFAITLNDCPRDTLGPYVCPTDCRLRPDQRAFELGRYELANEMKNAQEERQRATRRAREEGRMAPHRPRWFRAETDGDTGERVWAPSRVAEDLEYWVERERVWREGGGGSGSGAGWSGVDPIFIEEPDSIK